MVLLGTYAKYELSCPMYRMKEMEDIQFALGTPHS